MITQLIPRLTTLTFDYYGTLIDWEAGLWESFRQILGPGIESRRGELFAAYVKEEAAIESGSYRSYREVLRHVSQRLAEHFGVAISEAQRKHLEQLLPHWKPFTDSNAALLRLKRRFRLGVLSNIDADLFAGTRRLLSVDFDFVITAQDVQGYKPALGHFQRLLSNHAQAGEVLHVAQSLYHDGVPAQKLGIAFAWINRYNDIGASPVSPAAEFPTLAALADALHCP